MRVLTLDIETSPNLAHVWGLFKQNVSLAQLMESTRVISFAAKWEDESRVFFFSDFHDGHETMISAAWDLLDQADVVVHYNGTSFDIPHLRREFLLLNLDPPSPFKEVDLLKIIRAEFNFPSNKLDYVTRALGLGGKVSHTGHDLWVRCVVLDDPKAWALMKRYNIGDVKITEQLKKRILPWAKGLPNPVLYTGSDKPVCPKCGKDTLQRRGFAYTEMSEYQRFQCQSCASWSRSVRRDRGVQVRGL